MIPSALRPFPAMILAAFALGTSAATARAQAAPCAPDFKAIHDFKVGDVFQYRIRKLDSEPGLLLARSTEIIRKYRIHSRSDSGGTPAYRVFGLVRTVRTQNGSIVSDTVEPFDGTLRFADSAGHRLNRCQGDIVPFPEPGIPGAHTRVRVVPSDSLRSRAVPAGTPLKILGEVIGTRTGDTGLAPILDLQSTLTYGEGLGLVERIEGGGFWGPVYTETLTGYIRDGVIHGSLAADLVITLALRPEPAPLRVRARGWPWRRDAAAYDLRGRRVSLRSPALP